MKRNVKNRALVVGTFLLAAMLAFQPTAFADGIGKIIAVVQQLFGGVQIKVTAPTSGQALVFDGAGGLANGTPTATPSFPILAPNGSAAAPSYSFAGSSGSGYLSIGSNSYISNNGTLVSGFSGTGILLGQSMMFSFNAGSTGAASPDLRVSRGGAGNLLLDNNASSFGLLQLGGTTSAFPALKRNSSTLEVRVADDSDYGTIRSGIVQVADGSAGTPTYTWTNETTLGFYRSSAGVINATGTLISTSLGVNVTPGASGLSVAAIEASAPAGNYSQRLYALGNGSTSGGLFLLEKNRGTLAAPLIVQNNDQLGGIYFNGSTGIFGEAGAYATICGYVDGVPSGDTSSPGRLVFATTPSGSATPSNRWAILNAGNLVGTSGLALGWSSSSTDPTVAADTRVLRGSVGGSLLFDNNAGAFGRIQLGGITSSFPAIKRVGPAINIRLADDTDWATLACGGFETAGTATFDQGVIVNGATITPSNGMTALGTSGATFKSIFLDYTNTATVGNVTINKASGTVNLAAVGSTLTVTDSLVTANSHIFVTLASDPGVALSVWTVGSAGSFTINTRPATVNQTAIDFVVINAD